MPEGGARGDICSVPTLRDALNAYGHPKKSIKEDTSMNITIYLIAVFIWLAILSGYALRFRIRQEDMQIT